MRYTKNAQYAIIKVGDENEKETIIYTNNDSNAWDYDAFRF